MKLEALAEDPRREFAAPAAADDVAGKAVDGARWRRPPAHLAGRRRRCGSAHTAAGRVEIGVRDGVPAWLDVTTKFGHVHNELDAAEPPDGAQPTVSVHVHTGYGDIEIRRSATGGGRGAGA